MSLAALLRAPSRLDPLRAYFEEPGGFGGQSPPQAEFHAALDRKRFFRAANGIGKSYAGAAESWALLLGRHPTRVGVHYREGWLLADDLRQGWKSCSKALRALEPPGVLHPSCQYVDGVGYTYRSQKILALANGGLLVGKGGSQSPLAMEGDKIDFLWVDEPPKPAHWGGCRSRVNRTGGPIWVTLTPVNRPCGWLRALIDGDPDTGDGPEEPDWWKRQVPLTAANAPHLTPEQLATLMEVDPWDRPQRLLAEWEGFTQGRKFRAFTDEHVLFSDAAIPSSFSLVRLSWDFGEGVHSQVGYVQARAGREWLVLAEIVPAGDTPADLARATLSAVEGVGLTPYDFTGRFGAAVGDINTAGMLGGGRKYARFLEDAIAAELELGACPFTIEAPNKKHGSVGAGETAMNTLFRETRYRVHHSCRRLRHALRHYTGAESDLKHPIDAARYGIAADLLQIRGSSVTLRRG